MLGLLLMVNQEKKDHEGIPSVRLLVANIITIYAWRLILCPLLPVV